MSLLGSHYVPQGFVKIDLIAVLDISGVPAVFQVSNSLCYNYMFVTEFSFLSLKRGACFGVQVFFLMKMHISGEGGLIAHARCRKG